MFSCILRNLFTNAKKVYTFIISEAMRHKFPNRQFRQNSQKLKELILYISRSYANVQYSGKTKLNKLLFAIDFDAFEKLGNPVTGAQYKKGKNGPIPFSMIPVSAEMVENGELRFTEEKLGNFPQQRPIALRSPDMSVFSKEELAIINEWVETMRNERAVDLSRWSHGLPIWEYSDNEGFIPYNRIYWKIPQSKDITDRDRQIAEEIFKITGGKHIPRPRQL